MQVGACLTAQPFEESRQAELEPGPRDLNFDALINKLLRLDRVLAW